MLAERSCQVGGRHVFKWMIVFVLVPFLHGCDTGITNSERVIELGRLSVVVPEWASCDWIMDPCIDVNEARVRYEDYNLYSISLYCRWINLRHLRYVTLTGNLYVGTSEKSVAWLARRLCSVDESAFALGNEWNGIRDSAKASCGEWDGQWLRVTALYIQGPQAVKLKGGARGRQAELALLELFSRVRIVDEREAHGDLVVPVGGLCTAR